MAVLFLCTANSCRSQMAEGFFRSVAPEVNVYSAGTDPGRLHPRAIEVMREIGVDISSQTSKGLGAIPAHRIETVVTLCTEAAACPTPEIDAVRIHWPIDDPASATGSENEILAAFRTARDAIRTHVLELVRALGRGR